MRDNTPSMPQAAPPTALGGEFVSGVVLATARKYIVNHYPPGTLQVLTREVSPLARSVLSCPDPSAWYPDSLLLEVLTVVHTRLANARLGRFHRLVYDLTLDTMRYDFREVMDLKNAHRALASAPLLWSRLQRGAEFAMLPLANGGLCIQGCTSLTHPLYRQMLLAVLQALVFAASGVQRPVTLQPLADNIVEVRVDGLQHVG